MLLPKYKFYLGKSVTLSKASTSIDSIEFNQIPNSTGKVYIDYSPEAGAEELYLYKIRSANNFDIVQVEQAGMYTIEDEYNYIILYLTGTTEDAVEKHKEFRKYGFSNLYIVHAINPVYKKLTKKYAKESNQKFFRQSLEGDITMLNNDYKLIHEASIDQKMIFFVDKLNNTTGKWYNYCKSRFSKTDCKFDISRKKCQPKFTIFDRYNTVLDGYENTYDLIKLTPAISKIDMYKRPLLQIYIAGENTISNYLGGTYWEADVNEIIDDKDLLINKYYFSLINSGNEFEVEGSTISDVNGLYVGVNGVWKNNKGYTCTVDPSPIYAPNDSIYPNRHKIELSRDSDNEVLYRGEADYVFIEDNDTYIEGTHQIVLDAAKTFSHIGFARFKNVIAYHVYQRLLCDVDAVNNIDTYNIPTDDFVSDNRNYKKCIGISTGNIHISLETSDKPTKYGVNDYNKYFTNKSIYDATGLRPLPICRNSWANASLWYTYNDNEYNVWEASLRKRYILKDSYSIAAVIKALLAKIDPSLIHKETEAYSRFLYGNTQLAPIKWDNFKVYITQKTNILKGQYDQAAQKAEITLKSVMDMLRDCFRCYWFIEGNNFRIEHISYFINGGSYNSGANTQINFTKLIDQFNRIHASYFQSELEYDKSELAKRYEFSWMDDVTELFGPVNIDVHANYVQQDKTDEIIASNFSSDVDFMLLNPSNFSDDGFALLCPIKVNNRLTLPIITSSLIDENGRNYEMTAQNWYASWPYLVDFYKYDMPAYNVDVDVLATPMIVNKIKKCMNHTIELAAAEDPDELMLIETAFGDGTIEEISVNLDTRLTEIKLSYVPE